MELKKADLSERELAVELELIRRSLQCPKCGAATGDLSGASEYTCPFCREHYAVAEVREESRDALSYRKLKAMADLQVTNATLSSRMDVQYDAARFVDREGAREAFDRFLSGRSPRQKLFLLLGEAGFGKTWLVANWADRLRAAGHPVFYVRLADGLNNFFKATFGTTWNEALEVLRDALASTPGGAGGDPPRTLVWVVDGYDEVNDQRVRGTLLAGFLRRLEGEDNQLVVLTSRAYDWDGCVTRKDQHALLDRITWRPSAGGAGSGGASFRLERFTPREVEASLVAYGLPPLDRWPGELRELAAHPLWVRLIAEWHGERGALPRVSDRGLYDSYFRRMGLASRELRVLGEFAAELAQGGGFEQPVDLIGLDIDEKVLDALNSSGVFLYREDLYVRTVRLSARAFGWFGVAFHAFTLHRAKRGAELAGLLETLDALPGRDREVTIALSSSLGVPDPAALGTKGEAERKAREEVEKRARERVDYHGTPLYRPEHEVMVELEHLIGEPVPAVGEVEWNTFGFVAKGGRVVGLGLYSKWLASLPKTLGNLTSLKELYLPWNKLTSLPETLGNLTSLKILRLNGNQLKSLPETFEFPPNLQILNLGDNKLSSLPETLGNLMLLEKLWMDGNELKSLPETIGNLTSLKELYLYRNKLSSLPEILGNLMSLEILYLNDNQLKSLPETLGNLTSLKTLWLEDNELESLPETLGNLTSLTYLDLGDDQLKSLPETLGNLTSLEILNLAGNGLLSLPETLTKLSSLSELYVDARLQRDGVANRLEKSGVEVKWT
ncbi:MAG: leucine-rich repeat domain-containing protein [Promethearchaeota archaeon]